MKKLKVLVCRGPDCGELRGAAQIHAYLTSTLGTQDIGDTTVDVAWQSCFGQCAHGPNVLVREVRPGENALRLSMMPTLAPGAVLYHRVGLEEAARIVEEHLRSGRIVADLTRKTEPTQS